MQESGCVLSDLQDMHRDYAKMMHKHTIAGNIAK